MKRYTLFLLMILVAALALCFTTGCGKKDGMDVERINELWQRQVGHIAEFITQMEQVKEEAGAIVAMGAFIRNLDETIPLINEFYAKYPAFLEKVEKEKTGGSELSEGTREKEIAVAKLIAAGMFTESIINLQVNKFKEVEGMKKVLQRLGDTLKKLNLDDALKQDKEAVVQLAKLVSGEIEAGPALQPFLTRLRKAGITSRLKVTMGNIVIMARAIHNFKTDFGYPPRVKELDQLKDYPEFIPKYIKKLLLEDGWGNYLYYKENGTDYWLGSAGSDGKFNGFEQKGMYTELEGSDVVFSNGRFIFAPDMAGAQKQPPAASDTGGQ